MLEVRGLFSLCSQTGLEMGDQNEGKVDGRQGREALALPCSATGDNLLCSVPGPLLSTKAAEADEATLEWAAPGESLHMQVTLSFSCETA